MIDLPLKHFHMVCALLAFVSFFGRGIGMVQDSRWLQLRAVKVAPHVIDTLLLLSGIALAVTIHQYPLTHHWLSAKLAAMFLYIVLGSVALRRGRTKGIRVRAWVGALLVFLYIVLVAVHRNPSPLEWW